MRKRKRRRRQIRFITEREDNMIVIYTDYYDSCCSTIQDKRARPDGEEEDEDQKEKPVLDWDSEIDIFENKNCIYLQTN